jgi:hypothetical protein
MGRVRRVNARTAQSRDAIGTIGTREPALAASSRRDHCLPACRPQSVTASPLGEAASIVFELHANLMIARGTRLAMWAKRRGSPVSDYGPSINEFPGEGELCRLILRVRITMTPRALPRRSGGKRRSGDGPRPMRPSTTHIGSANVSQIFLSDDDHVMRSTRGG